jgi:RNA polymerase sigma-70 factor, ECF subfamily
MRRIRTAILDQNILELPTFAAAIPLHLISDAALIEQFRAGDRDAFTALYSSHYPAVFRFAFHMTADREKATELTQEVFVWLLHHSAEFNPHRGSLPAFLGGVLRKLLQRRQRGERRWLPFHDSTAAPSAGADLAIDAEALRKAIALLPFRYREAIVLCDLESRSYDEAAGILGCAVGTVRSRLHRGRELLARKFHPKKDPTT